MFPARASARPSGASLLRIKTSLPDLGAPVRVPCSMSPVCQSILPQNDAYPSIGVVVFRIMLGLPLRHEPRERLDQDDGNAVAESTRTLQALASFASSHRTLQFPRLRPDSAVSLNQPETLRQLAVKELRHIAFKATSCNHSNASIFGNVRRPVFPLVGWLDLPLSLRGVTAGISDTCLES